MQNLVSYLLSKKASKLDEIKSFEGHLLEKVPFYIYQKEPRTFAAYSCPHLTKQANFCGCQDTVVDTPFFIEIDIPMKTRAFSVFLHTVIKAGPPGFIM